MMAGSATGNLVARGRKGRSGFTLVEVLVVLAILIILFAMLFAPMIASLDMVTVGQAKVTMQTSARNSLTQMRREISNAMRVYPVPGVLNLGDDATLGTAYTDDAEGFIPNYSKIAFVGPEFADGAIVEPLAPRTGLNPITYVDDVVETVLTVELLDPAEDYSRTNPFVLVRKEGTTYQEWTNEVWEGAGNVTFWDFHPDEDVVRNVLSPRGSYDIPVSRTVCRACGWTVEGYFAGPECPACGATEGAQNSAYVDTTDAFSLFEYVHDNVGFKPERVAAESLRPTGDFTLFHSDYHAWAGFHNPGNVEVNLLNGGLMQLGASELDPRIQFIRPDTREIVRSTWEDATLVDPDSRGANIVATWNSDQGVVQVGASTGRWVNVPDPYASFEPGQYYPLQIQHERPDVAVTDEIDEYNLNGELQDSRDWDLIPIYPTLGMLVCPSCGTTWDPGTYNVGDPCPDGCPGTLVSTAQSDAPAMPIAYTIDPTAAGQYQQAKIVPGSVRVVIWGIDSAGAVYQTAYSETSVTDQAQIGPEQFAVVLSDFNQRAEVRFSEVDPPSPRLLTDALANTTGVSVTDFGIYIQYYYRRNYDPSAPDQDFVVRADYSTHEIMNLQLALQRYIEPQIDEATGVHTIPADASPDRVALDDQAQVRNLSR
ncbi:MAG: prepilin-type N-terminal cleavage/methylation domain-containing protein [Armatimonadota bacterium]